ncbi:MAG: glycosyltransferase family 1 protein [Planctomycetota bacterium]
MRFALVTDAWFPQVNGVVRTWDQVTRQMRAQGHEVLVVNPSDFRTIPAPRYPEIRLAILPRRKVNRMLSDFAPDAVHLATEGSLGQAGRAWCRKHKRPYTTSYHTQFPMYMKSYFGIPPKLTYRFIRWFHGKARATLVPTKTIREELAAHAGMDNVVVWSRGVDTSVFHPYEGQPNAYPEDLPRPIFFYAGRVAVEKNLEAFLALDLPGSKAIVGDGPARAKLQARFPGVYWAGYQKGEDLGRHFAGGDVFVFPSKTDTFGVVLIEANACGVPTAAYPVTGPIDVVQDGVTGKLSDDLKQACLDCLDLDRQACIDYGQANTWERCAQTVLDHAAVVA